MANVIQKVQKPTLILAHNKTLAGQLYSEFKELFPENRVESYIKVLYGIDTHHRGQMMLWNELIELANEIIGKEIIKRLHFIEK